jgi:Zn-dependent protease
MITIPGKIPIIIHPVFWLLITVLGWINSLTLLGTCIWMAVIFFSVLIHEFGHALTALAFGQKARIELVAMGGITHRYGKKISLWKEFLVVLNGPLAGLLLCAGAYWLKRSLHSDTLSPLWLYGISITLYANIFWTAVNLLPVHPLDGGRLTSIFLEALFGIRGMQAALCISMGLSLLVSLFLFLNGSFLGGALFLLLTFESYKAWQASLLMTTVDQNETLQELVKEIEEDLSNHRGVDAEKKLREIREKTQKGMLYISATIQLAKLLAQQNDTSSAYTLLNSIQKQLQGEETQLFYKLAYQTGHFDTAIAVGQRAYHLDPNFDTALTIAFSHALLKEVKPALGWLQRAIEDGLPNIKTVLERDEFQAIRYDAQFQTLCQKYH